MSKRRLFLYSILLGILGWAFPFFTGQYIEIKYQEFLPRMTELGQVVFEPISYERHWRRSKAKTRVILTDLAWQKWVALLNHPLKPTIEKIPPIPLVLEHEILHGPLIQLHEGNWRAWKAARVIIRSKLSLTDEARKIIEAQAGTSDLINFETMMSLLEGQVVVNLNGPSFRTVEQPKEAPAAWGGIKGVWETNSHFDKIKGRLLLPGFNFDIYGDTYLGSDIALEADRFRDAEGVWQGNWRSSIQNLLLDDVIEEVKLKVVGLLFSGHLEEKEGLADHNFLFRAEVIHYQDETFGPVSLNASFNHVPKPILQLVSTLIQNRPPESPPLDFIFGNLHFQRLLPTLLEARPTFGVEALQIKTPNGLIRGIFRFTVGGKDANNLTKPKNVINSMDALFMLDIPKEDFKALLKTTLHEADDKHVNEKIISWMKEGYVKELGSHYQMDMAMKDRQLTVHGEKREIPKEWFH